MPKKISVGDFKERVLNLLCGDEDYVIALDEVLNIVSSEVLDLDEIEEEIKAAEETITEIAEMLAGDDVIAALRWYLEDSANLDYADEYLNSYGSGYIDNILIGGMVIYWEGVIYKVIDACKEVLKDLEEEED